jgi:hypothetical protein
MDNQASTGDNSIQVNGKATIKKVQQKKVDKRKVTVVGPPAAPGEPPALYQVKELWRTPLTRLRLRVASSVTFIASLVTILGLSLWPDIIKPVFVDHGGLLALGGAHRSWLFIGLGLLVAFFVLLTLGRIAKHRLRSLSRVSWLPGLMEIDGRIVLVRFSGRCPGRDGFPCNSKLAFRSVPTSQRPVNTDKGIKWVPSGYKPAAVCPRDPELHRWLINTTQTMIENG